MGEIQEKRIDIVHQPQTQATSSGISDTTCLRRSHYWPLSLPSRHESIAFTHPLSEEKTSDNALVDFDGPNDPYRAVNWPAGKKLMTMLIYALATSTVALNTAIFSSANTQVAIAYGVSTVVVSLATSLILLGIALGPLLWAPLSELYGRKWVNLVPFCLSTFFTFGCGASANIQTILITRFFQGIFSGGIMANAGGLLADLYVPKERGNALIIYALSVVAGPILAPIIGSAIVTSYLGWRWTMYFVGIFQLFIAVVAALLVQESYSPVLLQRKASRLRHRTGNWSLHAKHEEWEASFKELARKYLSRPFQLMLTPSCLLMAFYASFVYGLIYGSLSAVPIAFGEHRGWSPVVSFLPLIALLLGCLSGLAGNTLNQKVYARAVDSSGGKPVPEARLYPMMFGSFFMAAGLFIFGWTAALDVHWIVPCIGLFLIGAGFFPIFQASTNYIVDTFLPYAASAIATITFMRCVVAAAFPVFMGPLLQAIGVAWGVSVFGFISVALLPVPFVFYTFGPRIRAIQRLS